MKNFAKIMFVATVAMAISFSSFAQDAKADKKMDKAPAKKAGKKKPAKKAKMEKKNDAKMEKKAN